MEGWETKGTIPVTVLQIQQVTLSIKDHITYEKSQ